MGRKAEKQKQKLLAEHKNEYKGGLNVAGPAPAPRPVLPQIYGMREERDRASGRLERSVDDDRACSPVFSADTEGAAVRGAAGGRRRQRRPIKRQDRAASWHLGQGGHLWVEPQMPGTPEPRLGDGFEVRLSLDLV